MMRKGSPMFVTVLAVVTMQMQCQAADEAWKTDYEAARKAAETTGKGMLLNFTGSDWCPPCIMLEKAVLGTGTFQEAAGEDYVLTKLDFPQDPASIDESTRAINEKLGERYGISGYPTLVLTDSEGRPFATTGYMDVGVDEYLKHLDELSEIRSQRDKAFAEAMDLEGAERAEAMANALKGVPIDHELYLEFYPDQVEVIKKADPSDETGFVRMLADGKEFKDYQLKLNGLAQGGDHRGALALTSEMIDKGKYDGSLLQHLYYSKGMILAELREFDKALEATNEAKKIVTTERARMAIEQVQEQIRAMEKEASAVPAGQ